ncbi:MAG TPA: DinB family protein [Chloroflexota bacterium]|nr:DinB family protein [Chloroflexota bacterium]
MDLERRRALVERYREGPSVVEAALAGATDAELDARPADGGWTARETTHHIADSELTSAIRLRRLIAEDEPEIIGYDGNVFAQRLYYGDRPVGAALAAISAARAVTAEILDQLTEAEWQRKGSHNEHPSYGVLEWLEIYAEHCHEHAEQIRAALGR